MVPKSLSLAPQLGLTLLFGWIVFIPLVNAETADPVIDDWSGASESITEASSNISRDFGNVSETMFNIPSDSPVEEYEITPLKKQRPETLYWYRPTEAYTTNRSAPYDLQRNNVEEAPPTNFDLYAPLPKADSTSAKSSEVFKMDYNHVSLADEFTRPTATETMPFGWSIQNQSTPRPTTSKTKRQRLLDSKSNENKE